ncbi:MAG: thioesterase family protein [Phototrophicaceae bacterium]
MSQLTAYRYQMPITVRFADLDALGHLNNAKYLTYIEQVRIMYVRDVCTWDGKWHTLGMILARTEIDYTLPIGFDDKVTAYARVSRLGNKSFDMSYILTRQREEKAVEIVAEAKTVMVSYDYEQDQTVAIPTLWRERITAYESDISS